MREKEILPLVRERLGIAELNPMQKEMLAKSGEARDIILISPTGSGKTLAFVIPMLKLLKAPTGQVQAVVIAPSRELVIQIATVIRELATGFKVTPLYGGHSVEDEVNSLSVVPDIVVATPGRLLDHATRRNIELIPVRLLVIDEFDKCLELGFEEQMRKIVARMKNVSRRILTSATDIPVLPDFIQLTEARRISSVPLEGRKLKERIRVYEVRGENRDKLEDLLRLLSSLATEGIPDRTIIFVNHRESADRVFAFLKEKKVKATLYHGALDQKEREVAVATFNAGSTPVMVATDLAARGLDIAQVMNIIHYHLPLTKEVYIHRNGRTARVDNEGAVYLLTAPGEQVKEYISVDDSIEMEGNGDAPSGSLFATFYISGGKKEKISRGDLLGFLTKEVGLQGSDVGKINVFDHYSLVTVARQSARQVKKHTGPASKAKIKAQTLKIWEIGEK